MTLTPVIFISHGTPLLALHPKKGVDFLRWANSMEKPENILVISAHWRTSFPTIGTVVSRHLIYDFFGFPDELYQLEYPAPGALKIADKVQSLVEFNLGRCERDADRGLDHGVWIPMMHMYPDADIPILQLSLPIDLEPRELIFLGEALAPLRQSRTLIVGSGGITHNLQQRGIGEESKTYEWALDFDQWIVATLIAWDLHQLLEFQNLAPGFSESHPTWEHFTPLLVTVGAANPDTHQISFPIEGFEQGSISRRCIQFS